MEEYEKGTVFINSQKKIAVTFTGLRHSFTGFLLKYGICHAILKKRTSIFGNRRTPERRGEMSM